MIRFTAATPVEERQKYWKTWLEENAFLEEEDIYGRQVYKVVEEAYKCNQFAFSSNEYEDTTKLVRVRIDLSQTELKYSFGLESYNVYGSGIFIPMEGLLLSPGTRAKINYDRSIATVGSRGQYLQLDDIPEDVVASHNWGLTIPALGGLFVPKKTRILNYIYSSKALQYFDIQLIN